MKTLTEFGSRLVTLHGGERGLRSGMACTVREVPGDSPMMDFIGSDDSVDRYNEVIDQTGWQLENFLANPVIPDCHDYSSILKILGRATTVQVKNGKLCNRVEFCVDNPLGLVAWKMAKAGFIKSQSVGFIPLEWENGSSQDEPERTYTKQELLEISLVVVPANPAATVGLALKAGALTQGDIRRAANLLKLCDSSADPDAQAGASGAGVHDAQLLRIARGLKAAFNPGAAFSYFRAGKI